MNDTSINSIYLLHIILYVKVSTLKLQYLSSLIKLRGGSVTVLLTFGRGDRGLKPPIAVSRLGQFRSLNIAFAF